MQSIQYLWTLKVFTCSCLTPNFTDRHRARHRGRSKAELTQLPLQQPVHFHNTSSRISPKASLATCKGKQLLSILVHLDCEHETRLKNCFVFLLLFFHRTAAMNNKLHTLSGKITTKIVPTQQKISVFRHRNGEPRLW